MSDIEALELVLKLAHLQAVGRHSRVSTACFFAHLWLTISSELPRMQSRFTPSSAASRSPCSLEVEAKDVMELISAQGDQHYSTALTVQGEGTIEVHFLVLRGFGLRRQLGVGPISDEVSQGLRLDGRAGDISDVEPHELGSPLRHSSCGVCGSRPPL
jgi:hypothetical protein